jgi:hypothetical protein
MTSAVVVAVLLSGSPSPSPEVDGHAVFARTQEVMLGGARLPWLLLASGSVSRSDKLGQKPSERFVLEWEPCGRRDVRGSLSKVAGEVLAKTIGVLCRRDPVTTARVDRNGSHVSYLWVLPGEWMRHATGSTTAAFDFEFGRDHVTVEIDPESGIVARIRLAPRWTREPSDPRKAPAHSEVVGTAELSDYKPLGTMRLPHRLQLQAGDVREDWTIEQIEIVPLP